MPTVPDYESYDYVGEWANREIEDRAEKKLLRALLPKEGPLLELGGGFGRLTETLTSGPSLVVMVDASARNVRLAHSRAPAAEIVRAELTSLPFREETFERLVMVRVVHHLPQPRLVFDEIARVARRTAVVIVSVPSPRRNQASGSGNSLVGVGPQGHAIYSAPFSFYASLFPLRKTRGVGMFDNAVGKVLHRLVFLHLLDVATSRIWRLKPTLFLKFELA
jgi:ubiquinone/menaquinone biosynthesis C-methylase UbiE